MKITLYKINIYQAFIAGEQMVRWFSYIPNDTPYYKHEILEEVEKELPEGITYDEEFNAFEDNGNDCLMITNNDGTVSLVSPERIINWF